MKDRKINIQVSWPTHKRLAKIGKKDDTYDSIISRLLNEFENKYN